MAVKPTVVERMRDGFQNIVARLGGAGDKTSFDTYGYNQFVAPTQEELEAAYRTSWLRKIVDIPPFDMTREWRDWQADADQIERLEEEEERLGVRQKVLDALKLSRLYGGAAILLGVPGSNPSVELNPDTVTEGGLAYVHALSRYELTAGQLIRDPQDSRYGEPEYYEVNSENRGSVRIHPSRVIRFIGEKIPAFSKIVMDGWGDPIWVALSRSVKNVDLTGSGIANLVHEAKLDVIRIPDLMGNLATKEYEDRLMRRFNLANSLKSINNMLLLDKEEEWDRKETTFTSLPDVLRVFLSVMCGMADIPATRLIGKSPDGMNATGDSDTRNYYDMLASRQDLELRPAIRPLDELLIRSALGSRPPEIYYDWAPLWQMTAVEKATADKQVAETAQIWATSGLIPDVALAEVVANRLIEDGTYPGLDQALAAAEAAGEVPPVLAGPTPAEIALAAASAANNPPAQGGNQPPPAANNNPPPPAKKTGTTGDAQPRSLYVRRDVTNWQEIAKWAADQGFVSTVGAAMHVTIAFSRTAVDWMKVPSNEWGSDKGGGLTIPPGGARLVEQLGQSPGSIVLLFNSSSLAWRHEEITRIGASWDFAEFQPHVTLTLDGASLDLTTIEPYRGEIRLGPEIFEEVDDAYQAGIQEEPTE